MSLNHEDIKNLRKGSKEALEEHLTDLREDLTQKQEEKHKKALEEFLYDVFGPEKKASKDKKKDVPNPLESLANYDEQLATAVKRLEDTWAQASTAITEHLAQKLKRESEAITGYEQNRDEDSDEESYEAIQEDMELSKQLKTNETRASQLMKNYDNVREQLPPTKAKVEETQRVVQMLKRPQSSVEQILKEGAPPVQDLSAQHLSSILLDLADQ